ncbi:hypothetical protein BJ912DRAFT_933922 [Pholiota molesta]|nr:hypothetical protein BJ912DRAFT_933922 [Pholiota molesta]
MTSIAGSNIAVAVDYQITLIANLISIGALSIQVWEFVAHLTDEVEYLWRGRFKSVKALYFCSRYVMLAFQIANQIFSYGIGSRIEKTGNCSKLFIFKCLMGHLCLNVLEMILLIRVYALYNKDPRVKYFLAVVFVSSSVLEITGTTLVIRSLLRMDGCQPPKTGKITVATYGSGAGLFQFVIFTMSLYKLVCDGRLSKTPLTSLMLREGIIVYVTLTVGKVDLGFCRAVFSYVRLIMVLRISDFDVGIESNSQYAKVGSQELPAASTTYWVAKYG